MPECPKKTHTVRQFSSNRFGKLDVRSSSALVLGGNAKQVLLTLEQVGDLHRERVLVDLGRL